MNTTTLHEATAVATAAAAAVAGAQELLLVPLSRLRPSSRNVRRSGGTSIPELAASIARVGLLQNLTVVAAPDGEHYDVVAGRRRLAALKLLVKRRKLAKDHEVHCLLVRDDAARTVSLTENVQREAMSPIDELVAWKDLVAEGRPVEDIAADFGVTPLVVQRRLRLANVSPRLLADFEAQSVTMEQLMALAVKDDHAAQEAAFYESPPWQRSPEALRAHLTREEVDASRDPVARFVGREAYEAAGGGVRRDLFADEDEGIFMTDAELLDVLARDRLAPVAEQVRQEGWGWVDVAPRVTHADLHQFQRARSTQRQPGKAEAKRIAKLEERQAQLQTWLDDDEELSDEEVQGMQDELDRLGSELDAIERTLLSWPREVVAVAGAVVSLDHLGGVVVHRGLLRAEQAKALRAKDGRDEHPAESDGDAAPASPRLAISEKLVKRLSAHRTAALQAEVARHPHVALVAVVHRLAQRVVLDDYRGSPLSIAATPQDRLEQHAPDVAEAPAAVGMREVRDAWAARLPGDSDALFTELLAMPQPELLSLLAVCVGLSVTAIASREDEAPAAQIARAVGLDMRQWWTPTAAGYFEHVSKAKALEAVQAFSPGEVGRLGKLKKAQIASEAERLAAGTGWLPAMLRAQEVSEDDVQPGAEGDGASPAAVEDLAQEHVDDQASPA